MGPSGSGKTSLLTVVAVGLRRNYSSRSPSLVFFSQNASCRAWTLRADFAGPCAAGFVDRAHVSGDILVNGSKQDVPKKLVGIVFQDDMMLPALTVFETMKFAADLRMSRGATEAQRQGRTLLHFSPQRTHVLWDTLGGLSEQMGSAEKWRSVGPLARGARR